jgi:acetyl-CoA carboxylase biotin carboxyl carrier protein
VDFTQFGKDRVGRNNSVIACATALLLNDQPQIPTNQFTPFQPDNIEQRHPLDLKQIKQIIELMKRSELTEFAVEEEGFKLKIRRGANGLPIVATTRGSNSPFVQSELPPSTQTAPSTGPSTSSAGNEEPGVGYIKSPMVGTFYRAASPESKPFADVGTKVAENSVVCIIEAMKIMNEIQAETKGTVLEALVENGQPVEYGQRLFKVKHG